MKKQKGKRNKNKTKRKTAGAPAQTIHIRTRLTATPEAKSHKDTKADGLVRVLTREHDFFPEFALYPKRKLEHKALRDAGLTQEEPRKWVLRTDRFNIFVYI